MHKVVQTFFSRFENRPFNWGNTPALLSFSMSDKSVRVKPASTECNPSLPRLEKEVQLPINLPQQCSEPVPPVREWGDADLADGLGRVVVV